MFSFDKKILSYFDFTLPLLILPIVMLSWFLINENNEFLGNKVLVYASIGFGVFISILFIPIRRMGFLIMFAYWVNIVLLIMVEFVGDTRLGAQRWLEIPYVHFTFQPSETMKIILMLVLAHLISKNPPKHKGYGILNFAKLSLYILLPFVFVLKQPDLGTALVLLFMGFGVLFLVGVNSKIWIALAIIIGLLSPILYGSLHDYQKKRIMDFISKDPDYQVRQAIITVGSGGFNGKEREKATQSLLGFLPIATSDFIFPYFVERFGFVGAVGLFILYGTLILHIFSMAKLNSRDYFLRVIAYCSALLISIYFSVNVAMTLGLAPVVGIPLPFFSYGGTSFIAFMVLFGILENLLAFRNKFVYNHNSFSNRGP